MLNRLQHIGLGLLLLNLLAISAFSGMGFHVHHTHGPDGIIVEHEQGCAENESGDHSNHHDSEKPFEHLIEIIGQTVIPKYSSLQLDLTGADWYLHDNNSAYPVVATSKPVSLQFSARCCQFRDSRFSSYSHRLPAVRGPPISSL